MNIKRNDLPTTNTAGARAYGPELLRALERMLAAHPLPQDLRRVPDSIINAYDFAEKVIQKVRNCT